jgi:hypothetical protein
MKLRFATTATTEMFAAMFAIAIGTAMLAATPAMADDQPSQTSSPKTMGDEGKLPATSTVGSKVPEMGATEPTTNTGSHTMGDTGKLPATNAVGGEVKQQTAPDSSK